MFFSLFIQRKLKKIDSKKLFFKYLTNYLIFFCLVFVSQFVRIMKFKKIKGYLEMESFEKIINLAKQTGFVFSGSEIYGGLANSWDYGPLGSLLKNNLKKAWLQKFVQEQSQNILLDGSILLNSSVWRSSGHLDSFSDPLTENKDNNKRFRADKLIEEHQPGLDISCWTYEQMHQYLVENKVLGTSNWTPIQPFNMLFQTHQGVVLEKSKPLYLRPETAQGIFIQFKNILKTTRKKIPFGVCQVGKVFRNEITPGNFIFRSCEFEQMELEFFCEPNTQNEWFEYWKNFMYQFLITLGMKKENLSFKNHQKEELSHYSEKTTDILFKFPWGMDELWGIASRTDFDLKNHQNHSKKDLTYFDPNTQKRYFPYVIEPSLGVERLFLALLINNYHEDSVNQTPRQVLTFHPFLAPYKVAVLPLIKKEHASKAKEIENYLMKYLDVCYDDTQSIGKRYRRQDMIGTPFCLTVDHETLEKNTVTLRNRDTLKQETMTLEEVKNYVLSQVTLK
ncbi:Glycyl-tRNA synthetase [Strawberry lethal yellows phytoplasma (CPA) str. NZSb11]|uniref:Glycine--tRNA ligase n=2 Tax=Phytoplasma australiense TaxID=59748 RepID=R4RPD3_PHYAS|nr:Glycyl-tRNA synthetase [Strawberry lethal yellows phytoplasma (CPA) str. NZSb11]